MIQKTKYFFMNDNTIGELRDSIEEVKQDIWQYKKENDLYCFIFRQDKIIVFGKDGSLIYESSSKIREFDAEEEVNG